jgi:hypothetical protein
MQCVGLTQRRIDPAILTWFGLAAIGRTGQHGG